MSKITFHQPEELNLYAENERLPHLLQLEELAEDFETNGIQKTTVVVREHKVNGKVVRDVLQGNRRTMAFSLFKKNKPEVYKKLFPQGIKCEVYDDLTDEEAVRIHADHGNNVSLRDRMELQLAANNLFAIGAKEAEIVTSLAGVMDAVSPMDAANRAELEKLKRTLRAAKTEGDQKYILECEREVDNFIKKFRHGLYQGLQRAYENAQIVMESLYRNATNIKRKGWEDQEMPIHLSQGQVYTLHKAFLKDLKKDSAYTKLKPGPEFRSAWEKILVKSKEKEAKKASGDTGDKVQRMSTKDIKDEIEKGQWYSTLAKGLLSRTVGDNEADIKTLNKLDMQAYQLEIVAEMAEAGDPSSIAFIGELESRAKEAIDADNASGQEAQKSGSSAKKGVKATEKK